MTVTPNTPVAAPTADAAMASRAAMKAMPAGMREVFASLLGEEPGAAQTDGNTDAAISANLDRTLRTQLSALVGKTGASTDAPQVANSDAKSQTPNAADVRQGILAQLNALTGQGETPATDGKPAADDESDTMPHPRTKDGKDVKTLPAVALAAAVAQQQATAKPTGSGAGRTIQPAAPRNGQDAAEKPGPQSEDGDPLKALANAAADNKHQAAPTQTTVAKALPVAFGAADAKDGASQQQSGDRRQQQQRGEQQTAAANPADALKPTAAPQGAQTSATPQASLNAPQAPLPAADAAAAPVQTAQTNSHSTAASLHIAAQNDTAPMPNLGSLAVNIVAKSKDGQKHFDIRLDPAELGRVDVKLAIDDAGKTQATLTAEKPQTLELLQRDRATLERALRDAGLDLAGNGLSFSLHGQDREQREAALPRGRALSASAVAQTDSSMPVTGAHLSAADSRLDIRV